MPLNPYDPYILWSVPRKLFAWFSWTLMGATLLTLAALFLNVIWFS